MLLVCLSPSLFGAEMEEQVSSSKMTLIKVTQAGRGRVGERVLSESVLMLTNCFTCTGCAGN